MKVKKGCVVIQVGSQEQQSQQGDAQRFLIPISYLHHPLFNNLLDMAYDSYGYTTHGPLKLPCSVDDFLHLRRQIEKESTPHHHHHHHNHHQYLPYA
ncbi:hypothetical protein RYX36_033896, partial [Vicia faba]